MSTFPQSPQPSESAPLRSSSPNTCTTATTVARTYYNSTDADTFYSTVWGGSHINIGIYASPSPSPPESINNASLRTIILMASLAAPISPTTRIVDLGAGYGGAARYLAKTYGCHVTCLNLSEVENERNRAMNREEGLDKLVVVVEGSFEDVPLPDSNFDLVWSQDAFLHSGDRAKLVREIDRVLVKECGRVVFTDPMAAEGVASQELGPILRRLQLESLGSVCFYRAEFERRGIVDVGFEDLSGKLVMHYGRVLEELERREEELRGRISNEYVRSMKVGLGRWIEGGKSGKLCWGILHFRR